MKLVIFGGRDFVHHEMATQIIKQDFDLSSVEFVDGCANGADVLNRILSAAFGRKRHKFPANWKRDGKYAGPKRNREMALFADVGVGFWNGASRGTINMYNILRALRKPVKLYDYTGKLIFENK